MGSHWQQMSIQQIIVLLPSLQSEHKTPISSFNPRIQLFKTQIKDMQHIERRALTMGGQ
jgi:hypothetical protein